MLNVQDMIFFDDSSTDTTSEEFDIHNLGDSLIVQVSDAGEFRFEGMVDLVSNTWDTMGAISLNDFSVNQTIDTDGVYMVLTPGYIRVRAVATDGVGTMRVFAILGK